MKTILTIITLFTATISLARNGAAPQPTTMSNMPLLFIANKGQITDQYGKPRRDIDYKLSGGDVTLFVGDGQLHYQWSKKLANPKDETRNPKDVMGKKSPSGDVGVTTYRMDVELLGADKNAVAIAEDMQPYYENYYLPTTPDGATAHSYRKITYKNVYPHIDWVLYVESKVESSKSKDEVVSYGAASIKYDFVVHPGGNVADIQLQYGGATALKLEDGALVATTPMGSVQEDAPYCYIAGSKAPVASRYVLEGNMLRYSTALVPAGETLVIDPSLKWGTYVGVETYPTILISGDSAGNAYLMGNINGNVANIATTGAYQTSFSGGNYNGYIIKFDATGFPVWGTYYGGNNGAYVFDGTSDAAGNVYLAGYTSSTGMATTGAYQTSKMGASANGFIVKFNNAGARQWATYYGDSSNINAIAINTAGEVYIVGGGSSVNFNYATTGAYATSPSSVFSNGFIAKLNAAGTGRMWGTYYFWVGAICVDGSGNLYTGSHDGNIASTTSGAHQTTYGGGLYDGFISKFSNTGSRLWATYYGGSGDENIHELDCDGNANVYISGNTGSANNIATTGSFLPSSSIGGAFLVKFNTAGVRQWGTYYASTTGSCHIAMRGIDISDDGYLYVIGSTQCSSGIATPGAYKTTITNTVFEDACVTIFNLNGQRQYATYYGGNGNDLTYGGNAKQINASGHGRVYFGGFTPSFTGTGIATTGAYRTSVLTGTGNDRFLAMFESDSNLYIPIPFTDTVACSGDTITVPYGVTQNFRSGNNFVFELSNTSGSFASGVTTMGTVAAQTGGVYNYIVPHSTTQSNLYRVRVRSTAPLDTAYEEVNIRISTKPQGVNATNNTPICSGNTINLSSSTSTSGVSYSWAGPNSYTSNLQNPSITNAQVLQSGNYIITFTNNGCISKDTTAVTVNLTPVTPTAGNNGPLCAGSTLQLTATSSSPGAVYNWSGPSFSSTTQNPTINSATTANSGTYSVYTTLGSCTSATTTTNVSVVNGPTINFYPSPNDTVCGNPVGSATLVAVPANPGSSPQYQWYKNGTMIPGATSTNYAASGISTGDSYYVVLTPGAGAACTTPITSNSITMTVMPYITPTVSISANPNTPVPSGTLISFTAVAADAGTNPKYQWKLNGATQGGATSNVWSAATFSNNDKVSCEVTSSYICPQPPKVTSSEVVVKLTTDIKGIWANKTPDIYPNPTKDKLIIEGISKGTRIQLVDVLGRTVINQTAINETEVLNTNHLIPGNYMLSIDDNKGNSIKVKVVKE